MFKLTVHDQNSNSTDRYFRFECEADTAIEAALMDLNTSEVHLFGPDGKQMSGMIFL